MSGVIVSYALWRNARPIVREAVLRGPDKVKTRIQAVEGSSEVAVIRKVDAPDERDGKFLSFSVKEKPFSAVVGAVKRANTIKRKKLQGG